MDRQQLKNLVKDVIAEIGAEITLTTSSVKLSANAKGDTTWEVKVYNPDPVEAANIANFLNAQLRAEHRREEFQNPERIPYPNSSTLPPGNRTMTNPTSGTNGTGTAVPSPAELRREAGKQEQIFDEGADPEFG
jgi:hypothetical protein